MKRSQPPDLTVELCGLKLANPFVLASGPLSFSAEAIWAAFSAGAAAVVTKTFRSQATVNPIPHMADIGRGGLLNTEGWSDFPAKRWLAQELPALADRDGVLIASLGHTPEEVAELARPVEQAGVDILELVSYRAADASPMVAAAKRVVAIPVLIKLSANWPNLLEVVDACVRAGADGVTAIDSIGPTLRINVETGRPVLGQTAWLSGAPIRPISQRVVADIALRHNISVVGTGGVGRGREAVEMMMAGATAVGVHTAPLLRGLGFFRKAIREMRAFLAKHDYSHVTQLQGIALPHLRDRLEPDGLTFTFDTELCTHCNRCVQVCAYSARELHGDEMHVDVAECRLCGLCVAVCKPGVLDFRLT